MTNKYYQTIQSFKNTTNSLIKILEKAKAWVKEKNLSEKELLNSSLIEDMFPLSKQIQIVSDNLKAGASRLANKETPSMEDSETTIDQLIERLQKTLEYVSTINEEDFANASEQKIILPWMHTRMPGKYIPAEEYLEKFLTPNFYFHVSIAYAILRMKGVNIGKMDYIGGIQMLDIEK